MGLFLFRFWPVLIPLLVYFLWYKSVVRKARKAAEPKPHFRDGPLYWMVFSMLMIALMCFVLLGFSIDGEKGEYVPPYMDNGVMVPGKVLEKKP